MALSKIQSASITTNAVGPTQLNEGANYDFTGTVTGVGGGTIVIKKKNNGSQDLSDATTTKINVGTEIIDTASEFDPSTSRYTPANGHYVMIIEYMGYPVGSSARGFSFMIYKNGSSVFSSNMYSNNSAHFFGNSDNNGKTITYYFEQTTATDYYEFYIYANTNSVNWNSSDIRLTVFKK